VDLFTDVPNCSFSHKSITKESSRGCGGCEVLTRLVVRSPSCVKLAWHGEQRGWLACETNRRLQHEQELILSTMLAWGQSINQSIRMSSFHSPEKMLWSSFSGGISLHRLFVTSSTTKPRNRIVTYFTG
jgi:hypothetical protein